MPDRCTENPIFIDKLQLARMKNDFAKRADKAKLQDVKYRESPDVVVKVVCRYRAELFFKISRKTKLSRLITSWTERMERNGGKPDIKGADNGASKSDQAAAPPAASHNSMQFIFTYNGRILEADQTPEDVGIDEGDEILAVELMDLTEGGSDSEEYVKLFDYPACLYPLTSLLTCRKGMLSHAVNF